MKTIIITLKGILLWVTALSIILFLIGGFESLVEAKRWLPTIIWLVINIILGYLCYCTLSYREFYKLSGCQWFEEKQSNQGLKSEFEKLRSEKVEEASTKVVNFYLQVGCGCGGSYERYHADVPIGQDIDDGDYISDFEDWMSNIEKGWV